MSISDLRKIDFSSVFDLENNLKLYIFRVFKTLRDSLLATFNETRAPTSRKYVAEQGIVKPIISEKLQFYWSHSSVFAFEKQL